MILKLIVEGAYSEDDESGALSKLNAIFNWSKEKTSPTNYRTVKVEIFEKDTWQHFLRRLVRIVVVCFVSLEVKKYGKAYESIKAIVNSV